MTEQAAQEQPGEVETKRPVGRPTKYEPRFCDELEACMAEGYSITAFAGKIGVSRSTINEWMSANPEFSEAVSRAKGKRLLHWETAALKVAKEGGGPGTATVIVFGLKNMGDDEWRDKQEFEHSGGAELSVTYVTTAAPAVAPPPEAEDYETD